MLAGQRAFGGGVAEDWQIEFFNRALVGSQPASSWTKFPMSLPLNCSQPCRPSRHNAIVVVDGGIKRNESAFTDEFYADRRDLWERYVESNPRTVA